MDSKPLKIEKQKTYDNDPIKEFDPIKPDRQAKESDTSNKAKKPISFKELMKYSDKWDRLLQIFEFIWSIAGGAGMPCSMLIFGDMMDMSGSSSSMGGMNLTDDMIEHIKKETEDSIIDNSLIMFGIACAMAVAVFFHFGHGNMLLKE